MSRRDKSVKLRRTRQKILVIVEGSAHKSEQTYFQLLARELRSEKAAVDVKVIPGEGEPSKLLSKCLAEKERHSGLYDHIAWWWMWTNTPGFKECCARQQKIRLGSS